MSAKPKAETVKVPCPHCSGRGIRSVATEDTTCAACDGKGTVNVRQPNSPDRR